MHKRKPKKKSRIVHVGMTEAARERHKMRAISRGLTLIEYYDTV